VCNKVPVLSPVILEDKTWWSAWHVPGVANISVLLETHYLKFLALRSLRLYKVFANTPHAGGAYRFWCQIFYMPFIFNFTCWFELVNCPILTLPLHIWPQFLVTFEIKLSFTFLQNSKFLRGFSSRLWITSLMTKYFRNQFNPIGVTFLLHAFLVLHIYWCYYYWRSKYSGIRHCVNW
jgi:hypothetical protein